MTLLLNVSICTLEVLPPTHLCLDTTLYEFLHNCPEGKNFLTRASSEQLAPFLLPLKTASSRDWRKTES